MAAISLVGVVVGSLAGLEHGIIHGGVGPTGDDFDPIGSAGWIGAMVGGVVGSGTLAISAFVKRFRRKLVTATARFGRCLGFMAALGLCSTAVGIYGLTFWGWGVGVDSFVVNVFQLIAGGVFVGIASGAGLSLIVGLLTLVCLAVVVLVRMSAGFLHPAYKRQETVSADLIGGGTCDPWPIRTVAALMPSEASRRWRDDFNEARYDYESDQHTKLLHDFLVHAPAVVVWAWIATVQRRTPGVGNSQERRW